MSTSRKTARLYSAKSVASVTRALCRSGSAPCIAGPVATLDQGQKPESSCRAARGGGGLGLLRNLGGGSRARSWRECGDQAPPQSPGAAPLKLRVTHTELFSSSALE